MLRAFISYSTNDREVAGAVKECLEALGVAVFMAHNDINVSQLWREEILTELGRMHVFVPLLSAEFRRSDWASQEVGFAIGRNDVAIIPASIDGTNPFGFLANLQGRRLPNPPTPEFFRDALATRFPREIIGMMIERLGESSGWRIAEANFRPLLPYLDRLTREEAQRIATVSTRNGEIWDAGGCRSDYLPAFIAKNRHQIAPEILRPLEYQIEHGEWYAAGDGESEVDRIR